MINTLRYWWLRRRAMRLNAQREALLKQHQENGLPMPELVVPDYPSKEVK